MTRNGTGMIEVTLCRGNLKYCFCALVAIQMSVENNKTHFNYFNVCWCISGLLRFGLGNFYQKTFIDRISF